MANALYNNFKEVVMEGSIDFTTNTIKLMLVTSGYTFDADHVFVSSVVPASNEFADASYSRATLGTKTVTQDDTDDEGVFDAADVTFSSLAGGETAAAAIIYKEVTNDADSLLIAYVDDVDFTSNGGDVTIQWNTEGIINLN